MFWAITGMPHFAYIIYRAGFIKRYGVRPSVCLSQHGLTAVNPLLQVTDVGPAGRIYRSIAAEVAGECGHVVSVHR